MTDVRPLLAFGAPAVGSIPKAPGNRPFQPPPRRPTPARQGQRLTPQFAALRETLAAGRIEAATETAEPDPELVVVFDLAGAVETFARAARYVPGLEFLAELDEDEAEPDEDFHYLDKGAISTDGVPETLYMVMSNAQAVTELIRLFEIWQADPSQSFDRGLNPLRQVFSLLRAIRRWGPQDRIRETGLLEAWEEDKQLVGQSGSARVEIELWFRSETERRIAAQAQVDRLITEAGGTIVTDAVVEAVGYHGILADLPYPQVEAVLQRGPDAIALLTTETIMFVSPARPMTIPAMEDPQPSVGAAAPLPRIATPRVALLDGVPLANHNQLAGRLVIDDPDDHAARYSAPQQHHGTAMASLICHGDLSAPGAPLSTRLYVRPILEPHPYHHRAETIARDELLVDLIYRAVHRMFEGDGNHRAAAPGVRVVNLSIGDPARTFARRMSPLAKLLDWLAHRYNLVILVSAGNHDVAASVPIDSLDDIGTFRTVVARATYEQARQRRLLSPAEAINVLTVGATHADGANDPDSDTVLDGVTNGMPAAYSAVGFGYRRSVKPEILLPGGRQLFQRPPHNSGEHATLTTAPTAAFGPGLRTAAPGPSGALNATAYSHGTSNATALATRAANEIIDVLETISPVAGEFPFPDPQYHPVLAKTLLVHAASWGSIQELLTAQLGLTVATARRNVTQLIGYGAVDPNRIASASRTRVVLLGAGSIGDGQRHTFTLPLPASLASTTEWRRLTTTLGWLSPVNTRSQRHLMARLLVQPPHTELGVARTQADHNAVRKGTIQHEVLEGTAALGFAANQTLTLIVDCRIDAGRVTVPVRYGLAVSLEMGTAVRADIHAEIRQALRIELRQRIRAQAGA